MECTITIDERLLEDAREALGTSSVQETIEAGLRAVIENRRAEELLTRLRLVEFDMTDQDLEELRRLDAGRVEAGDGGASSSEAGQNGRL